MNNNSNSISNTNRAHNSVILETDRWSNHSQHSNNSDNASDQDILLSPIGARGADNRRYHSLVRFLSPAPVVANYQAERQALSKKIAKISDEDIKHVVLEDRLHIYLKNVHEYDTPAKLNNAIAEELHELVNDSAKNETITNSVAKQVLYHTGALRLSMRVFDGLDRYVVRPLTLSHPSMNQSWGLPNAPALVVATAAKVSMVATAAVVGTLLSAFVEVPISALAAFSKPGVEALGLNFVFKDTLDFLTGADAKETLDAKLMLAKSGTERLEAIICHSIKYIWSAGVVLPIAIIFGIIGMIPAVFKKPELALDFLKGLGLLAFSPLILLGAILYGVYKIGEWLYNNINLGGIGKAILNFLKWIGSKIAAGFKGFGIMFGKLLNLILPKSWEIDLSKMTAMKGFLMFVGLLIVTAALVAIFAVGIGEISLTAHAIFWTLFAIYGVLHLMHFSKDSEQDERIAALEEMALDDKQHIADLRASLGLDSDDDDNNKRLSRQSNHSSSSVDEDEFRRCQQRGALRNMRINKSSNAHQSATYDPSFLRQRTYNGTNNEHDE